ncbi:MAG: HD domain-containing phosphohydrolase [Caldimonas sp.]
MDALCVGMFVHLDVGWMAHPFPLNSFKITSPQQVATIRGLGLTSVHWCPQQSDDFEQRGAAVDSVDRDGGDGCEAGEADEDREVCEDREDHHDPAAVVASHAAAAGAAAVAGTPGAIAQRRLLRSQRAAARLCEREFNEAARVCGRVAEIASTHPEQARNEAETLTRTLAAKMLGAEDLCIRLLTDAAGDKASTHAINVAMISLLMGRAFGFDADDLVDLGLGALLHDIGNIELPHGLRRHDETFTPAEKRYYETHVAHGLVLARRMGLSTGATLVLAQHHEHADGSGFPLKLNTDRMTIGARIVALVDRYDSLCNPAAAAKALTPHEALSLLFTQGNAKYDTSILSSFIRMMGVYPPGSTVQLTDDRYAMVVGVSSTRPLKPMVLVHDPRVARDDALLLDLEGAGSVGIRRSIRIAHLPTAAHEYLAPSPRVAYFFETAGAAAEAVEAG